ncbi:hypothetical protein GCM10009067_32040 [Haloarcula sebkhae]|uniref:Uncharacterized protein n=1 Tax=Haloarcula sebkhae TaxID=932660 RepID=A0A830EPB6_9EURY|nr:hypothetical protein GCM10009067_32040 [Haloarcula sebkhae]
MAGARGGRSGINASPKVVYFDDGLSPATIDGMGAPNGIGHSMEPLDPETSSHESACDVLTLSVVFPLYLSSLDDKTSIRH